MDSSNCCAFCPLSRVGRDFPGASSQPGEMNQCLPLGGEEGADSEEQEESSLEESKETVTLAFMSENTGVQEGLPHAQQQGKKKRKKKRLGPKDGEWGSVSSGAERNQEGRGPWLLMRG